MAYLIVLLIHIWHFYTSLAFIFAISWPHQEGIKVDTCTAIILASLFCFGKTKSTAMIKKYKN